MNQHTHVTTMANAQLIAAAPELLAALEHAARFVDYLQDRLDKRGGEFHEAGVVLTQASAAISKATKP